MSSLLEEAIVDAQELKQAALKNAEATILEKYSSDIKEAVDQMLNEQPIEGEEEFDLGLGGEEVPPGVEGEPVGELPDAPLASTEGEKLCPCPEEEAEIEIDFDQLAAQMQSDELGGELPPEDGQEPRETSIMGALEEEIEVNEETIASILEEFTADFVPQKSGWSERPDSDLAIATDELEASDIDIEDEDEDEDEKEKVNEENQKLKAQIKNLENKNNNNLNEAVILREENSKIKQLILKMKDRLDEVNTSNAKLLYTNRVLSSNSLNERQKSKLVEAISNAQSVEEAKVIFETLQSAVGSVRQREPKSLSEAVNRGLSSSVMPRKETTREADLAVERMKVLAGIT